MKPFIPLLLGTGREGRQSEHVAKYLLEILKQQPVETEFLDARDLATPYTVHSSVEHEKTKKWKDTVAKADAFVIVSPEYNHSYPGELKIILDSASSSQYAGKPVLIASVSSGSFGGVRMIEHLIALLWDIKLIPLQQTLNFSNADTTFQKSKEELDTLYREKVVGAFAKLILYTQETESLRKKLQ